jgi:rhamnosyl/mannosyltransferase
VGRLVYYKGLEVLLDAMVHCPLLRLALVGSGPLDQTLRARTRDRNLEQRVAFLGDVEDATLQAFYSACRFLVLPSTASSEAFGLVQLEAMAAGRPVIATNLPSGVPHVNQHQRTGLIVPVGDVAALARAMQALQGDEALCARLGSAGRARALGEFAEERVMQQWLELYSELGQGH